MHRPPSIPERAALRVAAAAIAALGAFAVPAAAQQVQRLTLEGPRVEIYDVVGRATLHRGTGSAVVVQATRVGSDAAQLQFATDQQGKDGAARLRVVFPADRLDDGIYWEADGGRSGLRLRADGTFGGDENGWMGRRGGRTSIGRRGAFHGSADLDIAVPEGRTVTLHLAVGQVQLTGTSGDFTVDTWGADVGAQDIAGSYVFDTGSGDVTVHGATGTLHLDTGSGNCTVSGVRGALLDMDTGSGDADATDVQVDRARFDTGSGNVHARGLQVRTGIVDTGSGDAELEFTGGSIDDWKVDTGSGDARITLPPQANATISLDTGSGDITIQRDGLTLQRRESDRMILRAGDGRGRLAIDTGSGDAIIR